ncbi:hypothetical protein An14g05040 [Aspergillus niger]|uniref:Uncharacterized protein n=2 Tax=Aspergillus niger TaxID=5061 RepID=A2R3P7_ASPNC|nr:hypothetical protein An14g05040 [Aspergillus niger]CAK42065.1 hypothetical protein An14g05040 [Aspergillus niger]
MSLSFSRCPAKLNVNGQRKSAEEPTRSPSIARLGIDSSFLLNGPMWIAQDRSAPFRASAMECWGKGEAGAWVATVRQRLLE